MLKSTAIALTLCCLFLLTMPGRTDPTAGAIDTEHLVVKRGAAVVRLGDVDARVARVPPEDRAHFMDSPQRIETVLLSLLTHRQLAAKARELRLHEDPAFERELALYADEVLGRRYLESLQTRSVPAGLAQLAYERYLANPSLGAVPERREVSHILIATDDRDEVEAKALVTRLYRELEQDPTRLEALAETHSDDPSVRRNRGRLGPVREDFDEAFLAAAATLTQPGSVVGPVRTAFGYHIIRLDNLTPETRLSFEEVRPALMMQAEQQFIRELRSREMNALQQEPMEADPEAVASLRTRYLPEAVREARSRD